jgi:small nuclear ribonucleoprotein (snRNP)-like protein
MALVESTLATMKGQPVVVVTSDHRAFRGTLAASDEKAILLDDAVEGTTSNTDQWTEVQLGDTLSTRVEGPRGTMVFQRPGGTHHYRLTRVLILMANVHRVWQVSGALALPKRAAPGDA